MEVHRSLSKPLVAHKPMADKKQSKRNNGAAEFHRRVFAKWGNCCYFCGSHATDAMHIIGRAFLGKQRYECPEANGRPGCRACHQLQTDGKFTFYLLDRLAAVNALNLVLKAKLPVPAA